MSDRKKYFFADNANTNCDQPYFKYGMYYYNDYFPSFDEQPRKPSPPDSVGNRNARVLKEFSEKLLLEDD